MAAGNASSLNRPLIVASTVPVVPDVLLAPAIDSPSFRLRLQCLTPNPLGQAALYLRCTGRAPSSQLWLASTPDSEIWYGEPVPFSSASAQIYWSVPTVTGYRGLVYVICGSFVSSNVVTFIKES